jgi:Fe-S-cluster containining protein
MDGDRKLVQIIDAAHAESAGKAGAWLVCRPGCAACCMGPFAITPLDAVRLRRGLAELEPERAARVVERARGSIRRLEREFPGDTTARVLAEDGAADNEPCPALDPATSTCDLYAARPVTCRQFGPPLRFEGEETGVCELCFDGATPEQIEACSVVIGDRGLETRLIAELPSAGETLVAYALAATRPSRRAARTMPPRTATSSPSRESDISMPSDGNM